MVVLARQRGSERGFNGSTAWRAQKSRFLLVPCCPWKWYFACKVSLDWEKQLNTNCNCGVFGLLFGTKLGLWICFASGKCFWMKMIANFSKFVNYLIRSKAKQFAIMFSVFQQQSNTLRKQLRQTGLQPTVWFFWMDFDFCQLAVPQCVCTCWWGDWWKSSSQSSHLRGQGAWRSLCVDAACGSMCGASTNLPLIPVLQSCCKP